MKKGALFTALVMLAMIVAARSLVADDAGAKISFARGDAWSYPKEGAAKNKLKIGSTVGQSDFLETGKNGRLEVKLPDGSVIRLGASARAQMKAVAFQATPPSKQVSARLLAGNAWAKVTSLVGGDSKFEIETENAVAGVRGTTFRVDARKDKSVLVRVYAGTVAAKGILPQAEHKKGERRQVPGPQEVTRNEWEKLVGKMMELVISSEGIPGDPREFAEAEESKDEWAAWNKERDKELGGDEH